MTVQPLGPSPDTSCLFYSSAGRDYWFCASLRSWQTARASCQSIDLDLVTIGSAIENQFVASHLLSGSWIGANDIGVEGAWRWAQSDAQFWQGAYNGGAVGGAYKSWSPLEPNNLFNQDCGTTNVLGAWTDEACSTLRPYVCEGVVDLCPADPDKVEAGQCGCGNPDTDDDGDGTAACNDACDEDDTKIDPGACGCGIPDTDSDGDGTPDCDDLCPADAKRIVPADCGCANAPKAAGTACDDGLCAANTLCDGAGHCGSPTQCGTPDSDCDFGMRAGREYWFCDNDRSFADARTRCQSVGMDVTIVETAGEDNYLTDRISEHSFIGGSDVTTEGEWLWVPTGDQFWSGGPAGSAVGGAYTNWRWGEPSQLFSTHDCIAKDPIGDGAWATHSCSTCDAYICERHDECPDDPSKLVAGLCGCGLADDDTDDDGTPDCDDECPWDPGRTEPGTTGCDTPACVADASSLTPIFDCVLQRPDGTSAAVFSVHNASACFVTVPPGDANRFSSDPSFRGQLTVFEPGTQHALTTPLSGALSWTLGSTTATASLTGPACETFSELVGSAVELSASIAHPSNIRTDGHKATAEPVLFEIPKRLDVTAGSAANANATLTFRNGGGPLVTCNYRGGSSSATPVGELEFARGRAFHFVDCSNGALAGSAATGTQWDLAVLGGDARLPATIVGSHLGPGCGGKLEPTLSPEQTVQLKTAFSWAATATLPETTLEPGVTTPLPAMYYTLIYVDDTDDLDLLEQSGVFFRELPLFPSELEPYAGHCGTVDNTGDLRGHFVFSLIPGTVYNYIRGLSIGAGATPPFRAVVLRTIPDAYLRNPDGTMSWQRALDNEMRFPTDDEEVGVSVQALAASSDDIRALIKKAIRDARDAIDALPKGDVRIRLRFTPYNRDELFVFGSNMARGWGAATIPRPHGVNVEVLSWAPKGVCLGHDAMDEYGRVSIRMPKGPFKEGSGICIHEKNAAGQVLEGSSSQQHLCDFADLKSKFGNLKHDFPRKGYYDIGHDDENVAFLTQATDGYDYMKYVAGKTLSKPAKINVGGIADLAGLFNGHRAFTPCLGYRAMASFPEQLARDALHDAVEFVVDVLTLGTADDGLDEGIFRMDMYLPTLSFAANSRALLTHEYGHYVMCDTFNDHGQLRALYNDRAAEDFKEEANDVFGLAMESFADFFTSQVASAINYPTITHHATVWGSSVFCNDHECLERNYRGGNSPDNDVYREQILRFVTTYHDAFDAQLPWRGTPNEKFPTDANGWKVVTSPPYAPVFLGGGGGEDAYGPDAEDDDRIMLPGAIGLWLGHASLLLQESNPGIAMRRGLAQTMEDYDANWCDICQLFGLHEPGLGGATTQETWDACTHGDLGNIVGPPPQEDLRIDAATCTPCGPNEGSDEDGDCFFCDPDERKRLVGPSCEVCADGEIAMPDQSCQPCLGTQITIGNTCVDCPHPQRANRATNTCAACAIDGVVDAAAFDSTDCGDSFFDIQALLTPGDICPNEFWVEIHNIDTLAASGPTPSSLTLGTVSFSPEVILPLLQVHQTNFLDADVGPLEESFSYSVLGATCGPSSGSTCLNEFIYDLSPMQTISAQQIEDSRLRSIRMRLSRKGPLASITHSHVFVGAHDLCAGPQ